MTALATPKLQRMLEKYDDRQLTGALGHADPEVRLMARLEMGRRNSLRSSAAAEPEGYADGGLVPFSVVPSTGRAPMGATFAVAPEVQGAPFMISVPGVGTPDIVREATPGRRAPGGTGSSRVSIGLSGGANPNFDAGKSFERYMGMLQPTGPAPEYKAPTDQEYMEAAKRMREGLGMDFSPYETALERRRTAAKEAGSQRENRMWAAAANSIFNMMNNPRLAGSPLAALTAGLSGASAEGERQRDRVMALEDRIGDDELRLGAMKGQDARTLSMEARRVLEAQRLQAFQQAQAAATAERNARATAVGLTSADQRDVAAQRAANARAAALMARAAGSGGAGGLGRFDVTPATFEDLAKAQAGFAPWAASHPQFGPRYAEYAKAVKAGRPVAPGLAAMFDWSNPMDAPAVRAYLDNVQTLRTQLGTTKQRGRGLAPNTAESGVIDMTGP